jgi:DNA-binding XRE family transcriptional regulator
LVFPLETRWEKRTLIGELGKEMHLENPTKQELAQKLGISRSSLYIPPNAS